MKSLKIKASQEEEDKIFRSLIERFDLNKSDIYGKGQEINFPITDEIEVWAKLELFTEYSEPDGNGQSSITERSLCKFKLQFMVDGEEIEVVRENASGKCLEDRIEKHYRI